MLPITDITVRAKCDGIVDSVNIDEDNGHKRVRIIQAAGIPNDHFIPLIFEIPVRPGDHVKNGDILINDSVIPSLKRRALLDTLKVGERRTGRVKNITDFGVVVDLDGIDGLLHITDLSLDRVRHPSDVVKPDQELEVVILDIDKERGHIWLGLNPWDTIESKYPVNARLRGKVVNLVPYGAFVELEPGIEGLVHVSEFSWTRHVARASDMLKIGDEVDVVVLSVNKEEQKIALGIRQTEENPWDSVAERYPVGTHVKGKVRDFSSLNAVILLEDGIDGMIHHPTVPLQKGQDIEAVVLEVDSTNQRISLELKQEQKQIEPLTPDTATDVGDFFYHFPKLISSCPQQTYLLARLIYCIQQEYSGDVTVEHLLSELQERLEVALNVDSNYIWNILPESLFSQNKEMGQNRLCDEVVEYANAHQWENDLSTQDVLVLWKNDGPPIPIPPIPDSIIPDALTEDQFLDNLTKYIECCGFKYSVQDIVRFHTSIKCGMLTLVGGNPGTGKSSLVELYFRALGGKGKNASSIDTFLRIDVNPSWMEPADLLGYNDAEGKFRPASNGFWRFLRDKQEDELLHPICLEEINLARVEHYFSDFIQMMSRGGGNISAGDNATDFIVIDDRVRFVGTCNSDETTHSMSLRLLDRCSFIELHQDEETRKQLEDAIWSNPEPKPLPFKKSDGVSSSTFNGWVRTASEKPISESIRNDFADFQTEFAGAGIAPSPRVVSNIAKYIRNRPAFNGNDKVLQEEERQRKALDECIAQRILSRYRSSPGTIAAFRNLKSKLEKKSYSLSALLAKQRDDEFKRIVSLSESWS